MQGTNLKGSEEASRIFPFLMSKIAQPHFSYEYSKFDNGKGQDHTAKIAIWKELG